MKNNMCPTLAPDGLDGQFFETLNPITPLYIKKNVGLIFKFFVNDYIRIIEIAHGSYG